MHLIKGDCFEVHKENKVSLNHHLIMRMRFLAWNFRGAGRAPTIKALKALAREESPDIIFFIAESKAKAKRINIKCGFS